MVSALFRLLGITFVSLILIFLIVLAIRTMGTGQSFAAPPHPWFEQAEWRLYAPDQQAFCGGDAATLPKSNWIVEIPVAWINGQWQVRCPTPVPIADFVGKAGPRDWILNVDAKTTDHLDRLVADISPLENNQRFAARSNSQMVSRYLRKKAPQWLFAADPSSVIRLQLFESLWVEPAMDFWPDFVIASTVPRDPLHLSPRAARELTRRAKRIIWDERPNTPAPDFVFHGTMTNRPSKIQ